MKKTSLAKNPTRNSLSMETRNKSVGRLNQAMADLSDLYSQSKQAHWNVRGPNFYSLHRLFDDLAGMIEPHLDTIAERVTALGGTALGTVRQSASGSALAEFPLDLASETGFVTALLERYALCANRVRQDIDESAAAGDADTADLLTEVSRDLDKALWFLEAHGADKRA